MNELSRTVRRTTTGHKGDWRPVVFLMTDGHPTDDPRGAVSRWQQDWGQSANLVAVSIGGTADHSLLRALTDDVILFDDSAPDAFARFLEWISQSIQSQSRSVSAGKDARVRLDKGAPDVLVSLEKEEPADLPFRGVDERYAVFLGRCQQNELPYLVKYEQHMGRIETRDPMLAQLLQSRRYLLRNTVPVSRSYFELSAPADRAGRREDSGPRQPQINSEELLGQPACPHCGAANAMAMCQCGGVHCVPGEGFQTCPWCGASGHYVAAAAGEGFDIGRSRG
jgi:hypothetical protein